MVASIHEGLGPRVEEFEIARNASAGLDENLSYLRLEYLDPDAVEVGRQLNDLLPTLWLMAGGLGAVPQAAGSEGYLIPDGGALAHAKIRRTLQIRSLRQRRREDETQKARPTPKHGHLT